MDRCALFVDAGYLLAAAGTLCCGTKKRADIICNYQGLVEALVAYVEGDCGFDILRAYWYDGARDGIPGLDHLRIGELPNVKVRLGRLSGGHQKGVDALVYRDLMTLSRERAMETAYLIAGDEDLREGVVSAQDMGVRVVLIGIPSPDRSNQAQTLVREADEHIVLPADFWQPHFARAPVAAPAPAASGPAAPATAPVGAPIPPPSPTPAPPPAPPPSPAPVPTTRSAYEIGVEVSQSWAGRAAPDEIRRLLGQFPRIPQAFDAQLLKDAQKELGSLKGREDVRRDLRRGFWLKLREIAKRRFHENPDNE